MIASGATLRRGGLLRPSFPPHVVQNDSTELGVPAGSHSADVRPSTLVRAHCTVSGGGSFDVPEGTIVPVLVRGGC